MNELNINKNFENNFHGIKSGLSFLKYLNFVVTDVKKFETGTMYYNFETHTINYFDFFEINKIVQLEYYEEFLVRRNLNYNKFYIEFEKIYCDFIEHTGFKHRKNIFSTNNFNLYKLLNNLDIQFFENIDPEKQVRFFFNFVLELQNQEILRFDEKSFSLEFNTYFFDDLKHVMNLSLDFFGFGINQKFVNIDVAPAKNELQLNKLCEIYESLSDEVKFYINDNLCQYVIVNASDKIHLDSAANNTLYEYYENNKNTNII